MSRMLAKRWKKPKKMRRVPRMTNQKSTSLYYQYRKAVNISPLYGKFKTHSTHYTLFVILNQLTYKVHQIHVYWMIHWQFIGKCQGLTITPFNAGHTIGGTIWKIRSPSSGTIIYAVNLNHMRERHLDGTVLLRQSAGGVFEPLARPDLLITDAERASVVSSRRKDRDAALIGSLFAKNVSLIKTWPPNYRYRNCYSFVSLFPASSLRSKYTSSRTISVARSALELLSPAISHLFPIKNC